jgi:hypothetical protein
MQKEDVETLLDSIEQLKQFINMKEKEVTEK